MNKLSRIAKRIGRAFALGALCNASFMCTTQSVLPSGPVDAGSTDATNPDGSTGDAGSLDATVSNMSDADAPVFAINGPSSVEALTYTLDYTVASRNNHTYFWTLDGPNTCINTDTDGCVLECSGCTITGTTSTGYSEYPSSHFYVAAPPSGSFTVKVEEREGTTVVDTAELQVTVVGKRLTGPARASSTADGEFWRAPLASRVSYPTGRVQSPMPASVVEHLRDIAAHAPKTARDNVFIKVGDSITVSPAFLGGSSDPVFMRSCLQDGPIQHEGGYQVKLPDDADLIPTILHFRSGVTTADNFDGNEEVCTPLGRYSIAAQGGTSADWAIADSPDSPVELEIAAMNPLFAWIAFGTNGLSEGGSATSDFASKLRAFQDSYFKLVDLVASRGIVPLLRTVPPRLDEKGAYQFLVPTFNALIRAKAVSMQVPLIDFYEALVSAPSVLQPVKITSHRSNDWGIGSDGIHPTYGDYNQYCWFDTEKKRAGLNTGYAIETLSALRGLDRLVQTVVVGTNSLDDTDDRAAVDVVDTALKTKVFGGEVISWGDVRSSTDGEPKTATYSDCSAPNNGVRAADSATGIAVDYRLELTEATPLRALVLDGNTDSHGVYLLQENGSCRDSGASMIATTVPAGRYILRVHAKDATATGEVVTLLVQCDPADTRCL